MHGLIVLSFFFIGWLVLPLLVRSKINRLRIALGDLARAVEGDTCTLHSDPINKALERAHKELGR